MSHIYFVNVFRLSAFYSTTNKSTLLFYDPLQVTYIMMDGASINRRLVEDVRERFQCYSAPSINIPNVNITYIMDPKVSVVYQSTYYTHVLQRVLEFKEVMVSCPKRASLS